MKSFLFLLLGVGLVLADDTQVNEFASSTKLFTADVYNELIVDNKNNLVVSPFSAETVLALTQSGAQGSTGEEIRTSLHLPDTKEETEAEIKSVLPTIKSDYISVSTANKIFVENNYPIKDLFKKVATDVYQADFQNIEFAASEEAANEINTWVEEHTDNKIHNLVSPDDFDASTKIVLVNALYFQGNWSTPFYSIFTKDATFYTSEDSTVEVTTMFQESVECNYYESPELDAQILEMPFQGEEATMTFVLPNKKEGIAVLEKQSEKVLATPVFTKEYVQVVLPKFKIETTINFKPILEQLGVVKVFDIMEADLSGIAGEKGELAIDKVAQKSYIDVNEVGVTAAAATEASGNDSLPPPATKFFTADHPFMFYIKVNDIVLFEGRVLVPEY